MAPRRVAEKRATRAWVGRFLPHPGKALVSILFLAFLSFTVLGMAAVVGWLLNAVIASGRTGGVLVAFGVLLLLLNLYAAALVLNKAGYSRNWIFWRSTSEAPVGEALLAAGVAWAYFTVFFSGLSCVLYRLGLVGTSHPVKSAALLLMGVFSYSWQLANALSLSVLQTWGVTYGNGFSGDAARVLLMAYELVIILPVLHVVARGIRRA
jgi:hypothetical protein